MKDNHFPKRIKKEMQNEGKEKERNTTFPQYELLLNKER